MNQRDDVRVISSRGFSWFPTFGPALCCQHFLCFILRNRSIQMTVVHVSKACRSSCNHSLWHFLQKTIFWSVQQSGFRKKQSPETATVHFVDHILEQMDKQRITGCTFLVLKKGFDLVDDHCLLHKLGNIMELESLKWFEDYLTTRTQKVKYNENVSSSLAIGYRVPLGSILSPILFVIYINDLPQSLLTTSIGMY